MRENSDQRWLGTVALQAVIYLIAGLWNGLEGNPGLVNTPCYGPDDRAQNL